MNEREWEFHVRDPLNKQGITATRNPEKYVCKKCGSVLVRDEKYADVIEWITEIWTWLTVHQYNDCESAK